MKILKSICVGVFSLTVLSSTLHAQVINENSSQFLVDLSSKHWAYSCVVDVVDKHPVMKGYPDHTFRGDFLVDRHELLVSLAKMSKLLKSRYLLNIGKKLPSGKTVLPVNSQHWSYQYARTLQENFGIIFPFGGNFFEKNFHIQREELALILVEVLSRVENVSNSDILSQFQIDVSRSFPDIASIKDKALREKYKKVIDRYQVLGAKKNNLFLGKFPVTRYELATSLCKSFKAIDLMTERNRLEVKY